MSWPVWGMVICGDLAKTLPTASTRLGRRAASWGAAGVALAGAASDAASHTFSVSAWSVWAWSSSTNDALPVRIIRSSAPSLVETNWSRQVA